MEDINKREEELRQDKSITAITVADTTTITQGAAISTYLCEAVGEAIHNNKKFRAVLEYDPECKKSVFYIKFDETENLRSALQHKNAVLRIRNVLIEEQVLSIHADEVLKMAKEETYGYD